MYLEAMHKKLKYCYMDGKQNRRVDKCISLLMRFARDMMFERTIRMMKNKPTFRMEQIAHSHLRSINIKAVKSKKLTITHGLYTRKCHIKIVILFHLIIRKIAWDVLWHVLVVISVSINLHVHV